MYPRLQQSKQKISVAPASDRSEVLTYDKAGRLTQRLDAEGFTEKYTYDAVGNKKTYTNQNNNVWTYHYDKAGRLTREVSPAVQVAAVDAATLATTTQNLTLETRLTYDALGNVTSRIEAFGRPEQRTTSYSYDAMGRQTRTTYETVGVYERTQDEPSGNGWGFDAEGNVITAEIYRTERVIQLQTSVRYNAFGEAISNEDVAGQLSFKSYDRLGRVVNEIDQNRNVTQHGYALQGVLTSQSVTRMAGTASALSSTATEQSIDAAVVAASTGNNRRVDTNFDRIGRTISSIEPTLAYSYDSVRNQGGDWARRKEFQYNIFGDLVLQRELLNPNSSVYADTYFFYHQDGKLHRTIDARGYLTQFQYNAFGEQVDSWEFAKKLDSWGLGNSGTPVSTAPSSWPAGFANGITVNVDPNSPIGHDRRKITGYDRIGNKTSESDYNVQIGRIVGAAATERVSVTVNTYWRYDGVGNTVVNGTNTSNLANTTVISGTDGYSLGRETYSFYDALGRAVATIAQDGATTTFARDAHGNAIQTVRRATASTVAMNLGKPTGFTLGANHNEDQISYQFFDRLGRVTRRLDRANPYAADISGTEVRSSYNARGTAAKEWQSFRDVDGNLRHRIRYFDYDSVGRQIATRTLIESDPSRTETAFQYTTDAATYNAFGEVISKTGTQNAYYDYDAAGRVWRTNEGDGVHRIIHYDLQGNVTREIRSPSTNLKTAFIDAGEVVPSISNTNGYRSTVQVRDAAGNAVSTKQPSWFNNNLVEQFPVISRVFDRWGNVTSQTDARGNTTHYRYNARNQVVQETKPQVQITYDNDPNSYSLNPAQQYFYDAWGQLIANRDAKGKVSTQQFDANGRLTTTTDASGAQTWQEYDLLGRVKRKLELWSLGREYVYFYDYGNRITVQQVKQLEWDGSTWQQRSYGLGYFGYDSIGQRIWEMTGAGDTMSSQMRRYRYDARGLVVTSQLPSGHVTQYKYDYAGRKIQEIDANGNQTARLVLDDHGRTLESTQEAAGALFPIQTWYQYNFAGELIRQWNNVISQGGLQTTAQGQNIQYTYYSSGQISSIRDLWRASSTNYSYDLNGNRTEEVFVEGSTNFRRTTTLYDTHNRITNIIDADPLTNRTRSAIAYRYDANNNRVNVYSMWAQPWLAASDPNYYKYVDNWFSYDALNRVVVVDGVWSNTTNQVDLNKNTDSSRRYYYDSAGRRIREDFHPTATTGTTRHYEYDFANRVTTVRKSNTIGGIDRSLVSTTVYDFWNGKKTETTYGEWTWNGSKYVGTGANDIVITEYNINGWVGRIKQQMQGISYLAAVNPETGNTTWNLSTTTYEYDGVGNARKISISSLTPEYTEVYQGTGQDQGRGFKKASTSYFSFFSAGQYLPKWYSENTYDITYTYQYVLFNGYRERSVSSTSSKFGANTVTTLYDVNGNTWQVTDSHSSLLNRSKLLITDNAGRVVQRLNMQAPLVPSPAVSNPPTPAGAPAAQPNFIGYSSEVTELNSFTALSLKPANPATTPDYTHFFYVNDNALGSVSRTASRNGNGDVVGYSGSSDLANVGRSGLALNISTASGSNGTYVVKQYDTLRSISKMLYGDENLWYVLAEANGLPGLVDLPAGTMLTTPTVARISNTASSFKPYNPTEPLGNTLPAQVLPPPINNLGRNKCLNYIGMAMIIVVSVAITVITAGAATAGIGAALGAMGVTVAAGSAGAVAVAATGAAVGGAMGSMASQALAKEWGYQDKINWKSVGISAISAGFSAGMAEAGLGFSGGESWWGKALASAGNTAVNSIVTQGIAVATGLQDEFSWKQVRVSAMAAAAATTAGIATRKATSWMGEPLSNGMSQFMSYAASSAYRLPAYNNGKLDWRHMAADAFGNVLGNAYGKAHEQTRRLSAFEDSSRAEAAARWNRAGDNDADNAALLAWAQQGQATVHNPAPAAAPEVEVTIVPSPNPEDTRELPYLVQKGDTIYGLAGGDKEMMGRYILGMGLKNPNQIRVGQKALVNWYVSADEAIAAANRYYAKEAQRAVSSAREEMTHRYRAAEIRHAAAVLASANTAAGAVESTANSSWWMDGINNATGAYAAVYSNKGPDLVLGAAETAFSALTGSIGRVSGGLTSIPALADSMDAARAVQEGVQETMTYSPRSEGARVLGQALAPVGRAVAGAVDYARTQSEGAIGDGWTTVLFGTAQFALEAGGAAGALKSIGGVRSWQRVGGTGNAFGIGAKLSFDTSLNVVDRAFGREAGSILAENGVGRASYARLQAQGTEVRFVNDAEMREMAVFNPYDNTVTVNMLRHTSADEVASTIVHEAVHQNRFFRSNIAPTTQYEEYLAFRNEFLFSEARRPSLVERRQIMERVQDLYPHLPSGKKLFGGQ